MAAFGIVAPPAIVSCLGSDETKAPQSPVDAGLHDVGHSAVTDTPDTSADAPPVDAVADTATPDASDAGLDVMANDASDAADATDAPDAADASDAADGADAAKWVFVRIDDCAGNDRLTYSTGSDVPVEADCDLANAGLAAVCWDQTTYTNNLLPSSQPGCTYKSVTAASCTGGGHPGYLYVCTP